MEFSKGKLWSNAFALPPSGLLPYTMELSDLGALHLSLPLFHPLPPWTFASEGFDEDATLQTTYQASAWYVVIPHPVHLPKGCFFHRNPLYFKQPAPTGVNIKQAQPTGGRK